MKQKSTLTSQPSVGPVRAPRRGSEHVLEKLEIAGNHYLLKVPSQLIGLILSSCSSSFKVYLFSSIPSVGESLTYGTALNIYFLFGTELYLVFHIVQLAGA